MKILRDAAKERRKNGEKFSTMAPDEVLKQQLKHLFGGDSDSQGSEPDGGGVLGAPPRAPPPASMPHPGASRQQQQQQRHPRPLSTRVPSADSEPALLPAPPVEPARQLRYVVPAKDAEKENVSTHGGGYMSAFGRGCRPPRISRTTRHVDASPGDIPVVASERLG